MRRYFILVLLIVVLSFLQVAGISVFDAKPNLALVAVIAASFFISDIWEGFLLILISALILKFGPAVGNKDILIFSLLGALAVLLRNRLPWQATINFLILIILGTLCFYLILSPSLIPSSILLKEIVYNVISGMLIFALLSWLKIKKKFF